MQRGIYRYSFCIYIYIYNVFRYIRMLIFVSNWLNDNTSISTYRGKGVDCLGQAIDKYFSERCQAAQLIKLCFGSMLRRLWYRYSLAAQLSFSLLATYPQSRPVEVLDVPLLRCFSCLAIFLASVCFYLLQLLSISFASSSLI